MIQPAFISPLDQCQNTVTCKSYGKENGKNSKVNPKLSVAASTLPAPLLGYVKSGYSFGRHSVVHSYESAALWRPEAKKLPEYKNTWIFLIVWPIESQSHMTSFQNNFVWYISCTVLLLHVP